MCGLKLSSFFVNLLLISFVVSGELHRKGSCIKNTVTLPSSAGSVLLLPKDTAQSITRDGAAFLRSYMV